MPPTDRLESTVTVPMTDTVAPATHAPLVDKSPAKCAGPLVEIEFATRPDATETVLPNKAGPATDRNSSTGCPNIDSDCPF